MAQKEDSPHETALPYSLVQRLVITSLVFGLIGGLIGGRLLNNRGILGPASRQQLQVQEDSAVIDVAKKVSPSVVSITSQSQGLSFFGPVTQEGAGTGIIISSDGLILTNKHVVPSDASTFSVFTSDGKEYKNATVVARDPINDIAFVRIKASGLKAVSMGDSGSVQVGQRVVAIGNALGQFQNSVTTGVISGLSRPIQAGDEQGGSAESLQNLFQTDAAINPGNSGGPLVNLSGQVIGINTAIAGNAQNIGFAIPINEVKPDIDSLNANNGKIIKPYLGVRYVPITKEFASANNLKVTDGAYVSGDQQNLAVIPDSPAAKAGLQAGDIITKVDGQQIDASHQLSTLLAKHKVTDKVTLTVLRGNDTKDFQVTLEAAPSQG